MHPFVHSYAIHPSIHSSLDLVFRTKILVVSDGMMTAHNFSTGYQVFSPLTSTTKLEGKTAAVNITNITEPDQTRYKWNG